MNFYLFELLFLLSVFLSLCLSLCLCLSSYLYSFLCIGLPVLLSLFSFFLSRYHSSSCFMYLNVYFSICFIISVSLSLCPSVSLFLCLLSIRLCVSCLSVVLPFKLFIFLTVSSLFLYSPSFNLSKQIPNCMLHIRTIHLQLAFFTAQQNTYEPVVPPKFMQPKKINDEKTEINPDPYLNWRRIA